MTEYKYLVVGMIGKYQLFYREKEKLGFKLISNYQQENMNINLN
jgi:hypothetical protein